MFTGPEPAIKHLNVHKVQQQASKGIFVSLGLKSKVSSGLAWKKVGFQNWKIKKTIKAYFLKITTQQSVLEKFSMWTKLWNLIGEQTRISRTEMKRKVPLNAHKCATMIRQLASKLAILESFFCIKPFKIVSDEIQMKA